MFKERLQIVGNKVIYGLGYFAGAILLIVTIGFLAFLGEKYIPPQVVELFFDIMKYILILAFALLILFEVSTKLRKFINWLFIEPFKKGKGNE